MPTQVVNVRISEDHLKMEKTLGQLLRAAMERRGIKGVDLAQAIGRSESFVSELINDEKKVPPPARHVGGD